MDLKYFDQIKSYSEGSLSSVERKAFEEQLKVDEELHLEYDSYIASQKVMEVFGFDFLEKKLENRSKSKPKLFKLNPKVWAIAAGIILLMGMGLFWFTNQNYGNGALVDKYYMMPNFSSTRSNGKAEALSTAADSFYKGNYGTSLQLISFPSLPGSHQLIHQTFLMFFDLRLP